MSYEITLLQDLIDGFNDRELTPDSRAELLADLVLTGSVLGDNVFELTNLSTLDVNQEEWAKAIESLDKTLCLEEDYYASGSLLTLNFLKYGSLYWLCVNVRQYVSEKYSLEDLISKLVWKYYTNPDNSKINGIIGSPNTFSFEHVEEHGFVIIGEWALSRTIRPMLYDVSPVRKTENVVFAIPAHEVNVMHKYAKKYPLVGARGCAIKGKCTPMPLNPKYAECNNMPENVDIVLVIQAYETNSGEYRYVQTFPDENPELDIFAELTVQKTEV